jgi:hippurate hydrolase
MARFDELLHSAHAVHDDVVSLRRRIHAYPELGLDLPVTQAAILEFLAELPLEVTTGDALSSVTAVLDTGRKGPTVLLRADMDALPMHEDTGLDFASTIPMTMHACGHDSHVAMLAGAAQVLCERRDQLTGKVAFMFQPGEEGHHGARFMLDEGMLAITGDVDLAFAIHQSPNFPSGSVATRAGTLLASVDDFVITVKGKGGHASMPHQALDPIPVACEIVMAIQTMVTRRLDVFNPGVVTVARISAGTTSNVIPEVAEIEGTMRSVSARTRKLLQEQIVQVARGVGAAHGAQVDVEVEIGFPVTVNDAASSSYVAEVASELVGPAAVFDLESPIMGAEDFSYVLEQVPGAMAFLGTRPVGVAPVDVAPNHSNRMMLDEDAMDVGVALYAAVASARCSA